MHSEKPVSHPEKAGTAVGGVITFVAGVRPTKDLAHVAAPVGISIGMPRPRRLREGASKIAFSAFGKGLPNQKKTISDFFDSSLLRLVRTFCLMCFWRPKCCCFFPAYLRCFFMSRTGDFFGHDQDGHLRNASSGAVRPKSPVARRAISGSTLEKGVLMR